MLKKIILTFVLLVSYSNIYAEGWGGFSIDKEVLDLINKILPKGGTILELGSGWTSGELSKDYTVYSIEHNPKWMNKYDTNYIYAPIKNHWYDVEIVKNSIKDIKYDIILVDGPPGPIGRNGFLINIDLFNTDIPIILDDTHRRAEYLITVNLANKLNRKFFIYEGSSKNNVGKIKTFAVIMPDNQQPIISK